MPKISYLIKESEGKDTTLVTSAQIEQKIADIKALMRGMIDEDNLLSYEDDDSKIAISPSNVIDMPLETRPANHCMKFFGITREHPAGIVDNLFEKTVDIFNLNPSFSLLNGIGDKEIVMVSEGSEKGSVQRKSVSIEIPVNYSPMTWGDLWNYIYETNNNIGIKLNPSRTSIEDTFILEEIDTLADFLEAFSVTENEYVFETSYNLSANNSFEYFVDISTNQNSAAITATVSPYGEEWVYRAVTSILCRINP